MTRRKAGSKPPLSVVMPVHNALPYLDRAIESILTQTFSDFEFVMLDDASTDGSSERLREWAAKDGRIRLIRAEANLGPVASSRKAAGEATAPIVARMDADDVSLPTRLQEQVEVLERHADIGMVGCLSDTIDLQGKTIRRAETWRLLRQSPMVPFAHSAMMYRRDVFERAGGYRDGTEYWEDQDLAMRMAQLCAIAVIPRPLLLVRQTVSSIRTTAEQDRILKSIDRMYQRIDRSSGLRSEQRPAEQVRGAGIDPRAFISVGSPLLWSGKRPRLFRRLLKHGKLRPDFRTAKSLAWTAWASLSPSSLRAAVKLLNGARERFSGPTPADPLFWPLTSSR